MTDQRVPDFLVLGEVMLDVALVVGRTTTSADGVELGSESWLGAGGSATVARALHSLGRSPLIAGAVGGDTVGMALADAIARTGCRAQLDIRRDATSYLRIHRVGTSASITGYDGTLLEYQWDGLRADYTPEYLVVADFNKQDAPLIDPPSIRGFRVSVVTVKSPERVSRYRGADAVVVSAEDLDRETPGIDRLAWARAAVTNDRFGSVILTAGPDGCLAVTADTSVQLAVSVAADERNPAGAGDSFAAKLASGLADGRSIENAAREAMTFAAETVESLATGVGKNDRGGP